MIPGTHSNADGARSEPCRGVREVPPPAESGVASWFDADLADAFAVPIEQCALSHQCGFSSTAHGNDLSEADQWIKLARLVEVAEEVWGEV